MNQVESTITKFNDASVQHTSVLHFTHHVSEMGYLFFYEKMDSITNNITHNIASESKEIYFKVSEERTRSCPPSLGLL